MGFKSGEWCHSHHDERGSLYSGEEGEYLYQEQRSVQQHSKGDASAVYVGQGVNGDWYYYASQFGSVAGIWSWGDKISLRPGGADVHLNNNPFFTMYQDPTTISLNELLGSASIAYDPADWLDFTYRAGVDYETDRDNTLLGYYDVNAPQGQLIRNWNNDYQVNTDLQGRASHKFSENFTANLLLGFHLDQIQYNNNAIIGTTFINPNGPPSISNDATYVPGDVKQIIRDAASYGQLSVNFFRQLYVNFAGRDESSSTYGPNVPSLFFYPAVNAAWEFTKLPLFKNNSILNFGKVRAAYGQAADQPPVYSTATYYTLNPIIGNGFGPEIGLQYYYNSSTGIGGALIGAPITNDPISGLGTEGNPNLGPEKTSEFE